MQRRRQKERERQEVTLVNAKKCCKCSKSAGPRSRRYCDYHAGYHAGLSSKQMIAKRSTDAAYAEAERLAVKKRMRALRAKRRATARGAHPTKPESDRASPQ